MVYVVLDDSIYCMGICLEENCFSLVYFDCRGNSFFCYFDLQGNNFFEGVMICYLLFDGDFFWIGMECGFFYLDINIGKYDWYVCW